MIRVYRIIRVAVMLLLPAMGVRAQNDRVIQRMFLVGDAGELRQGRHPVCDWLKQHVDWNDTSNVLVYLGIMSIRRACRRRGVRIGIPPGRSSITR